MKTISQFLKVIMAVIFMWGWINQVHSQTDSTSKRILPDFNTIILSTSTDIKLTQGNETSVTAAKGTLSSKLITEVKDNVLSVKGKSDESIIITFKNLNRIELRSVGDVRSTNQINSDKLEVYLNRAASDIDLDVNVKELSTTIEGAGDVKYKGAADSHKIVIKGAGDVNAYGLETNSTNVEVDGAGDAKLNAKQDLKGTINGAGDITYLSEPATKDVKVNGVGSYGLKNKDKTEIVGDNDTTKFKLGNKKVLIIGGKNDSTKQKSHNKKFKVYWAGFGLGVNGYLNALNQTKVPTGYEFLDLKYNKSINVSFNFLEQKIPIWRRHINIVTGLGWDISNYRFTGNYRLIPDSNYISGVKDSTVTYKKNKLTTSYLNVPLLLQFDTNPFGKGKRTVHLSAGIVGSLRIGSHTKQVFDIGNTEYKPKTRDSFDLNTWRYSAMLRFGIGKIDLYASYAMNGLFKKNQGPELYPFTIGITLASF